MVELFVTISWPPAPFVTHRLAVTPGSFYLAGTMMPFNWQTAIAVDWKGNEPTGLYSAISTAASRTAVLWPSGGSVGASAGGSGVLDRPRPSVPSVRPAQGSGRGLDVPVEVNMAVDWGSILQSAVGGAYQAAIGQLPTPYGVPSMEFGPATMAVAATGGIQGPPETRQTMIQPNCGPVTTTKPGPRYLTYDCHTGEFIQRRRRRRKRLLTQGDQHDLGVIVAMFGKGAAGQIALAAAVKR